MGPKSKRVVFDNQVKIRVCTRFGRGGCVCINYDNWNEDPLALSGFLTYKCVKAKTKVISWVLSPRV